MLSAWVERLHHCHLGTFFSLLADKCDDDHAACDPIIHTMLCSVQTIIRESPPSLTVPTSHFLAMLPQRLFKEHELKLLRDTMLYPRHAARDEHAMKGMLIGESVRSDDALNSLVHDLAVFAQHDAGVHKACHRIASLLGKTLSDTEQVRPSG
jgi:hypothetical protein